MAICISPMYGFSEFAFNCVLRLLLYWYESLCASLNHGWDWSTVSFIIKLWIRWRSVVSFTPRLLYPVVNLPRYRLNWRLGGSQSWYKLFGGGTNLEPVARIEARFLDRPALAYPLCRLDDTAIIPILLLIFELRDTGFYRTWIFFILLLAVVFFIPQTT